MNKFKFTSYLNDVQKDLNKGEKRNRRKAAAHLVKRMKENVSTKTGPGLPSQPGEFPHVISGDLKKGIGSKDINNATLVGVGPPAHHAHLLEFGTEDRHQKNGKNVGKVEPRPFVFKTFEEEADETIKIMREPY